MDVHELARKMNKLIGSKVKGNEEEWLAVGRELEEFCKKRDARRKRNLAQRMPNGRNILHSSFWH